MPVTPFLSRSVSATSCGSAPCPAWWPKPITKAARRSVSHWPRPSSARSIWINDHAGHHDSKGFSGRDRHRRAAPKALRTLSDAFAAGIRSGLESVGLRFEAITPFATPRRLAVRVEGLQERQQDKLLEKFGPAVSAAYDKDGNPSPAASGFAR